MSSFPKQVSVAITPELWAALCRAKQAKPFEALSTLLRDAALKGFGSASAPKPMPERVPKVEGPLRSGHSKPDIARAPAANAVMPTSAELDFALDAIGIGRYPVKDNPFE